MSIYEKDISKLWVILIITILISIMLVGYSYSYTMDNISYKDISLTTVYNTGRNTCVVTDNDIYSDLEAPIKGIECKFTVMGYNNSNDDFNYKIIIKSNQNSTINGDLIKMSLTNNKEGIQIGPFNGNILENNNFEEEFNVLKKSEIFDEYTLKMWISEEELINNNWYNLESGKFLININVIH